MNHDVFITYHNHDMKAAKAVCQALEQNGIKCWMAPRDIPPGSDYDSEIENAIMSTKAIVVIFSETSASSQWLKGEIDIGYEEDKPIVVYRIGQTPLVGQNRFVLSRATIVVANCGSQKLIDAIRIHLNKPNKEDDSICYSIRPISTSADMTSVIYRQKLKDQLKYVVLLLMFIALALTFIFLL